MLLTGSWSVMGGSTLVLLRYIFLLLCFIGHFHLLVWWFFRQCFRVGITSKTLLPTYPLLEAPLLVYTHYDSRSPLPKGNPRSHQIFSTTHSASSPFPITIHLRPRVTTRHYLASCRMNMIDHAFYQSQEPTIHPLHYPQLAAAS